MIPSIVIFGTSGHAKVVHDIIVKEGKYKPATFFSLDPSLKNFLGLPQHQQDDFINHDFNKGIVAIGDNWVRSSVVKWILSKKPNFEFINAVHPSAVLGSDVKLGMGIAIMANVVVNPSSVVNDHVILNTSCSVDHDCHLGSYSSIAPGAVLGGNVKIGNFSAVSLGANIIHGITVGEQSVIGAGSLVLENVDSETVVYGSPCKFQRKRTAGDKYL